MNQSDRVAASLIIAGVALIAFALIIPAAVMTSIWDDDGSPPDTVLRIGLLHVVDSLNPTIGTTKSARLFYSLVYDCLQSMNEDLEVVPNLATSWYPVPTADPMLQLTGEPYGSVWQYNLTHNAFWHDGVPFTADDVVFTFNLNAWNYSSLWSYQQYSYFMKATEKIDNYTVRSHFYERGTGDSIPVAFADMVPIPILPKHKLGDMDPVALGFNWTGVFVSEDLPIIGTGPFTGTSDIRQQWLAGYEITLSRNDGYHAKKDRNLEVHFDKIRISFYEDARALRLALASKQIDIARFDGDEFLTLQGDAESGVVRNVLTYRGLDLSQDFVYLSWAMKPVGPNPARLDPTIRIALAMATNKSSIASDIYDGLAQEATTLTSPISPMWHYEPTPSEKILFDPEGAKKLLEDAGYVDNDGDGIRECTSTSFAVQNLLVPDGKALTFSMVIFRDMMAHGQEIGISLQDDWQTVGVRVDYRVVDSSVWPVYCPVGEDVALMASSQDLDPNEILFAQSKRAWGGWSDTTYFSQQYEDNYNLSVSALSVKDRERYVDNCQRIHYLDMPYLNLVYTDQLFAWRNDSLVGWGYWSAAPGMSLDNIWGAPPLMFSLVPIAIVTPGIQHLVPYTVAVACGSTGLLLLVVGVLRRRTGSVG